MIYSVDCCPSVVSLQAVPKFAVDVRKIVAYVTNDGRFVVDCKWIKCHTVVLQRKIGQPANVFRPAVVSASREVVRIRFVGPVCDKVRYSLEQREKCLAYGSYVVLVGFDPVTEIVDVYDEGFNRERHVISVG